LLHHQPRHGYRMHDILDTHHRSAVELIVHDSGIQRHMPVTIGQPAIANGLDIRVRLRNAYTLLHGIERPTPLAQDFPRARIRGPAKIPGAHDDRPADTAPKRQASAHHRSTAQHRLRKKFSSIAHSRYFNGIFISIVEAPATSATPPPAVQ